jgi:hypothetical protein
MKASATLRFWYTAIACLLWAGIYLSGFAIHWLLYLPACGFTVAALTGICPSHLAVSNVIGDKEDLKKDKIVS